MGSLNKEPVLQSRSGMTRVCAGSGYLLRDQGLQINDRQAQDKIEPRPPVEVRGTTSICAGLGFLVIDGHKQRTGMKKRGERLRRFRLFAV